MRSLDTKPPKPCCSWEAGHCGARPHRLNLPDVLAVTRRCTCALLSSRRPSTIIINLQVEREHYFWQRQVLRTVTLVSHTLSRCNLRRLGTPRNDCGRHRMFLFVTLHQQHPSQSLGRLRTQVPQPGQQKPGVAGTLATSIPGAEQTPSWPRTAAHDTRLFNVWLWALPHMSFFIGHVRADATS